MKDENVAWAERMFKLSVRAGNMPDEPLVEDDYVRVVVATVARERAKLKVLAAEMERKARTLNPEHIAARGHRLIARAFVAHAKFRKDPAGVAVRGQFLSDAIAARKLRKLMGVL